jgi:hypothetical protein
MNEANRKFLPIHAMIGGPIGPISLDENLTRYLKRTGWERQPPGPAGSLWYQRFGAKDGIALAVPESVDPDQSEWIGIVRRLAAFERRPESDIAISILTQYVDITRLRAANEYVITGTIPLEAGVSLVSSAHSMLRAAGTTARRPRGQIAGNYSNWGDEIVGQARMAHTEDGSYVVPIWMPLTPPVEDEQSLFGEIEEQRMPVETAERRVTRTLAQSLEAVQKVIVRPDHEVRNPGELLPVIAAGGSRELLVALRKVLEQPAVAQFEAQFSWAGGLKAPGGVSREVVLHSEAAPLLDNAARMLRVPDSFPQQIYTGQIVVLMHKPGDPYGEIGIDTVRQNRSCEVRVRLATETLDLAYEWARTERAVLAEGEVRRGGAGRKLRIDAPTRVLPLDETFLPSVD